jgi:hypothetical protein
MSIVEPQRRDTWLRRGVGVGIIAIAIVRIVSTYPVFNQTYDEPISVGCGMEWLDRGTYSYNPKHPPLGRVAAAIPSFVRGGRTTGAVDAIVEGNAILSRDGEYWKNLVLARLAVLPFFVLACVVLWAWTEWAWGSLTGLVALGLFSLVPTVLGHAGIAMTDIVLTATLPAALFSLCLWLESPSIRRSLILGACTGLALLSKLTALVYLPLCGFPLVLAFYLYRRRARDGIAVKLRLRRFLAAGLTAALLIWAGYRFSLRPIGVGHGPLVPLDRITGTKGFVHDAAYGAIRMPVPAGDFFRGIAIMWIHNHDHDQWNYFLGDRRASGWWFFYPVVVAVKTPLPFLVLLGAGLVFIFRKRVPNGVESDRWPWRRWAFVGAMAGIFMAGLLSQVNTGIRHILPVYVMLAGIAAFGAFRLLAFLRPGGVVCAVLLVWLAVDSAMAHPDYLPYYGEFTDGASGRYGVDSDLDYGQDLERLRVACSRRRVPSLAIAYHGTADLRWFRLPDFHILAPGERPSGWVAISMNKLKLGEINARDAFQWLEHLQPVERVGKSIRLYFIPEKGAQTFRSD